VAAQQAPHEPRSTIETGIYRGAVPRSHHSVMKNRTFLFFQGESNHEQDVDRLGSYLSLLGAVEVSLRHLASKLQAPAHIYLPGGDPDPPLPP
jgi:hypothetical protein